MTETTYAAEQRVLGRMLLGKDWIADAIHVVRPADFHHPAHALIFEAILDLYGRGDPADPVTVTASLDRAGTLGRVGGMAYLHDLVHAAPTGFVQIVDQAQLVTEFAADLATVRAGEPGEHRNG